MGALLNQLKYHGKHENLQAIVDLLCKEIKGKDSFDLIIPIPASKYRSFQPVYALAEKISNKFAVPYLQALTKNATDELKAIDEFEKRMQVLQQGMSLVVSEDLISGKSILLVDDLYRSGSTLQVATSLLIGAGCNTVSLLTMTKTRTKR